MKKCKRPPIEVGSKFHLWDRNLWHIIDIFQDGDEEMIVLKSWAKYRNGWIYQVEYRFILEDYLNRHYEVNSKEE